LSLPPQLDGLHFAWTVWVMPGRVAFRLDGLGYAWTGWTTETAIWLFSTVRRMV
jgi:hypothetical protein